MHFFDSQALYDSKVIYSFNQDNSKKQSKGRSNKGSKDPSIRKSISQDGSVKQARLAGNSQDSLPDLGSEGSSIQAIQGPDVGDSNEQILVAA